MSIQILKAIRFALVAHGDQKRKYTNEPYMVHPLEVAMILEKYNLDDEIIIAAILHDVLEDTPVTFDQIRDEFGLDVATLVNQVTDKSTPEDGNRAARKAIDRKHLAVASAGAQAIKCADLINNTSSIVKYDPKFAQTYLGEKAATLKVLNSAPSYLWREATNSLLDAMTLLGKTDAT
jgi:(p)ppGpp synthase/HD superfamily hydrolase